MLGGKNDLERDKENNKKNKDTISRYDMKLSILNELQDLKSSKSIGSEKY